MPGLTALKDFAARKTYAPRCQVCAGPLPESHEHLVEPGEHRPLCACAACGVLFDEASHRYRRVPRDARRLALDAPEELWAKLEVPVDLVFFQKSGATGRITAFYPSPAGVLESLLALEAWSELAARNPALGSLREDVEALLVNRAQGARDSFIAPLDECFRLVGLIRSHWNGFSGGDAVREKTREFFAELSRRADAV